MLLLPLFLLSLFTLTTTALPSSSSPNLPRAASLGAQVRSQIDVLNASVIELTSAVNNYDGSLLGLIPQSLAVVSATAKVDATTVKTAWLTQLSANFTAAESESVVTTLASLITPIQGSLSALESKVRLPIPFFLRCVEVLVG